MATRKKGLKLPSHDLEDEDDEGLDEPIKELKEPTFTLRGQDKLAANLVRKWAVLAASWGCPAEKVAKAREIADAMDAWEPRKYPD